MSLLQAERRLFAFLKTWADEAGVALYTHDLKDANLPYGVLELQSCDTLCTHSAHVANVTLMLVTQSEGSLVRTGLLEGLRRFLEFEEHPHICVRVNGHTQEVARDNFTHTSILTCQVLLQTHLEE
ncbi:MAG: hypothetical protein C0514_01360 [Candidatus Puniceispirillum sp.]|nr:hypothetical protein [Candidatus Puniceispirillum sp.]